jgi:phosphatidylserine decarboxylase
VNDWAIANVERLFAVNERIVSFVESELGLIAVVMVGATNVGRIALSYCPLETNLAPWSKKPQTAIDHVPPVPIQCGAKIGTFKMGSSVVLLTERRLFDLSECREKVAVKFGQSLELLSRGS